MGRTVAKDDDRGTLSCKSNLKQLPAVHGADFPGMKRQHHAR